MQTFDIDAIIDQGINDMQHGLTELKQKYSTLSQQLQQLSAAISEQIGAIKGADEMRSRLKASAQAALPVEQVDKVEKVEALATEIVEAALPEPANLPKSKH